MAHRSVYSSRWDISHTKSPGRRRYTSHPFHLAAPHSTRGTDLPRPSLGFLEAKERCSDLRASSPGLKPAPRAEQTRGAFFSYAAGMAANTTVGNREGLESGTSRVIRSRVRVYRPTSYASHATDFSLSCIETHTTASTDPIHAMRTDDVIRNAYDACDAYDAGLCTLTYKCHSNLTPPKGEEVITAVHPPISTINITCIWLVHKQQNALKSLYSIICKMCRQLFLKLALEECGLAIVILVGWTTPEI
ncbi:hypothetical protein SFRURICE_021076, partial [Spodoptera frugiperda]